MLQNPSGKGAKFAGRTALVGAVLLCAATGAVAEVTAEPAVLVFHNTGQTETVRLIADGEPLSAYALTAWRFLVDTRNYSHMMRVVPTDDGLRITPSDTVETGSYVLSLTTPRGSAAVHVFTPLTDHQSSVEALAQRMNVSVDDVRRQMGLSRRLGRDEISLGLLPVYYLGQRIQVEIPGTEGRVSLWKINGETVAQGTDAHRLDHVAQQTGPLLVAYEEYENGALAASAGTLVEVVREPAIPHEVKAGAQARFEALPGFSGYQWRVDGKDAGTGATLEYMFAAPGAYTVELLANNATAPGPYAFREVRYEVTVRGD